MNHVITNPRGIDIPIQRLQTLLHEDLDWSADSDFYGRALKVNSDTGYSPRGFVSGQGYTDVFTDDRKSAKLFFLIDDDITSKAGLLFTAQVKIVVMANIEKILGEYPSDGKGWKGIRHKQIDNEESETVRDSILFLPPMIPAQLEP
ncbi:MAG: hypothetical protein EB154_07715 [Nitrosopumilaceae archaeon]|nr:hypothetical protein [Nitrosopumilaceae archaeon]